MTSPDQEATHAIVAAAVMRETQCTPEMALDAAKRSAKEQAGEVITVESAGLVIAGAVEIVMTKRCSACGEHQGMHKSSRLGEADRNECCRCYVLRGQPPADWHEDCMRTYQEIHAKPAEEMP